MRRADLVPANSDVFWGLWLRERPLLLRMCARWLGCHHQEAEDILSRGALKAVRFLRTRPLDPGTFRAWALRIVHNLCVDRQRAGGRERARFVAVDAETTRLEWDGEAYAPERALLRGELGGLLDDAVASLPQRLRATFDLRVLEDRSYEAIAEAQAITPANARKRVQQAREHLRQRLAGSIAGRL